MSVVRNEREYFLPLCKRLQRIRIAIVQEVHPTESPQFRQNSDGGGYGSALYMASPGIV